ncbi:hypothetical protein FAEPRAM212_01644 [Faecalibacterium prausnitzii M21/2]|uniref:Uncharacterized protein n=1 Tax=Faecalibacterium prausnitzii M21/2 TaxID=411485 RepID=A8SBE6_9FIRM|nr:hypothetical protein FAEPRAM212_01644 [Faecalibacterium prausnitzii M21/2]
MRSINCKHFFHYCHTRKNGCGSLCCKEPTKKEYHL